MGLISSNKFLFDINCNCKILETVQPNRKDKCCVNSSCKLDLKKRKTFLQIENNFLHQQQNEEII